jgi:hypothetical protein
MWDIMTEWEMLGRAIDGHMRGHARHVLNVFWLGYYLLHSPALRKWVDGAWHRLVAQRASMSGVHNDEALEAMSDVWFYAALFHDVGYCMEKQRVLLAKVAQIQSAFSLTPAATPSDDSVLRADAYDVFQQFDPSLRHALTAAFDREAATGALDHGAMSAVSILRHLGATAEAPYAREAARAIVLHNLLPKTGVSITWTDEPVACLLLLCDQLQAWDRERSDVTYKNAARIESAELEALDVSVGKRGRIRIEMVIDYIAPRHLRLSHDHFLATHDNLEQVLRKFPEAALSRIVGGWPFDLHIAFTLSGETLAPTIRRPA